MLVQAVAVPRAETGPGQTLIEPRDQPANMTVDRAKCLVRFPPASG
jgi:hypothetical protein